MPLLIPNGRQHPAGTGSGRDRVGDNAGFGPIPQVVTREQGISSASAGPRPSAVDVLVVPVADGEVDDGLVGQLGVRAGPRPVWAATIILLAATGRASWPSHTKSDRTFGTLHCGSAADRRLFAYVGCIDRSVFCAQIMQFGCGASRLGRERALPRGCRLDGVCSNGVARS